MINEQNNCFISYKKCFSLANVALLSPAYSQGQKIIQQQQNNKKPANFAFHGMKAQQQLILFWII